MKPLTLGLILLFPNLLVAEENLIEQSSSREFGDASYGCGDTIAMAKDLGIDYRSVVDACLQGEDISLRKRAFSLLLWISAYGGFDGAGSQGHASVVGSILRKFGDKAFSDLSRGQPLQICRPVALNVAYGLELFDSDDAYAAGMRGRYPLTFEVLGVDAAMNELAAKNKAVLESPQQSKPKVE